MRDRNDLVVFQRKSASFDSRGGESVSWIDLADEWAKVTYGRGSERRQAAALQSVQAATLQVDGNAETYDLRTTDRVILRGHVWDIAGISPDKPRRGDVEVDITATGEAYESGS